MRLLLDTHALLWWWNEDKRLSAPARHAIARSEVFISPVALLELATKFRLGKLPDASDVLNDVAAILARDGFRSLPVSLAHGRRAGSYEADHGDPFDRLLAAQAELENFVLVTKDRAFSLFPCATHW